MSTQTIGGVSNNSDLLNQYIAQQQAAASTSTAAAADTSDTTLSGLGSNFNTFLKILTTQLQYQDPTAATDTNQFTQELVQFAGVEQQINTNTDLQSLITLQKNSNGLAATIGYIGKYVEAPTTSTFPLQGGQAELAYTLPSAAKTVSINVIDSTGKTVTTLTGPTGTGLDRVAWDGKDSTGTQLADGAYSFQLSATDASGNAITVTDVRMVGLVTSIQSNSDGTTALNLGTGMTVSSSAIDAVYDSSDPPIGTLGDPDTGGDGTSQQTTS
jgi:flagellar basal-body rod modification protein FlgD